MSLVRLSALAAVVAAHGAAAMINAHVTGFAPDQSMVLQHVVNYWSVVIVDPVTVNLSISMLDINGDLLGSSFGFTQDAQGRPSGGTIQIDNRAGSAFGWFADPTPESNEEFTSGATPFHWYARNPGPAADHYDLLSTLHHEFAHLFGFSSAFSSFASLLTESVLYPPLRDFNGSTVSAVITAPYEGTHLSDAIHPFDLLNPYQTRGQRLLPSDLDLAILGDAFGYALDFPTPQPVPEPVTVCLTGAGLSLLWLIRRRRFDRHASRN